MIERAHFIILEVDDVSMVREMDQDILSSEAGKVIEKFSFHIGWSRAGFEEIW